MGKLSRSKGVAWERHVAKFLTEQFGTPYERVLSETRDGNSGDVVGIRYLVQCKVGAAPNPLGALQEAVEAAGPIERIPVAIIRKHVKSGNRKPIDAVVMRLDDWLALALSERRAK